MACANTRSKYTDVILGDLYEMPKNQLPTDQDVLKNYYFIIKNKNIPFRDQKKTTINVLVPLISSIWTQSSIPFVSEYRIEQKIEKLIERHNLLIKNKNKPNFECKRQEFLNSLSSNLFDIARCKCTVTCLCDKQNKVPKHELSFLEDQKHERKMFIGSLDKLTTKKNLLRIEKQEKIEKKQKAVENTGLNIKRRRERSREYSFDQIPSTSGENAQCRLDLGAVALECDRFMVSDRAASRIVSAAFESIGEVSEEKKLNVVDRSKIRRERKRIRKEISHKTKIHSLQSIFFDGRRDETLVSLSIDGALYPRKIKEEHIAIVEEPFSQYVGHVAVERGTAEIIVDSMMDFFEQKDINLDQVNIIGCDGTNVNVGRNNGIIVKLEERFNRPMQWCICLLHLNEVLLRHIFETLDGKTSGPKSYTGDIGKKLLDCEKKRITNFQSIDNEQYQHLYDTELSRDQNYLLDMCKAVTSGEISQSISLKKPGPLSHSRWLTTASRILRLYMSEENLNESLRLLASYVVNVYASMWFLIKFNPSITNGSKHFFEIIQKTRYLPDNLKLLIDEVIQRNGYFAHHENILLSMVHDNRENIRKLAYQRILNARKNSDNLLRKFKVPRINFDALEYFEIIHWKEVERTDPPVLQIFSNEEILSMMEAKTVPCGKYTHIPCHTQSVERAVKLVTEASSHVCNSEERDKYIKVRLEARNIRNKFETKQDF